jgi:protocatechuate 3,4-dioxygenase, alpha subunit
VSRLPLTSSQTVGPFFGPALLREGAIRQVLVARETKGTRIRIEGRVTDGDGEPVPDALVEIWQANAAGRYNHPADTGPAELDPGFLGFGRCGTQEDGRFWFQTIKPGRVRFSDDTLQAPHICLTVFSRGLLNHVATRLYFDDEPGNRDDPVLCCVPEKRRSTLVAVRAATETETTYRFPIVLQGAGETAFFQI